MIRTLKVSDHPSQEAHDIYVAGQVVTALRFEKEVDPTKTKLLAWEGRFESPLVGGRKVVLEPIRDLHGDEAVPLLVTLVDGTEFAFLVKRPSREEWGWIDHQVNVFKDPDSYNAVLSSLYDSLYARLADVVSVSGLVLFWSQKPDLVPKMQAQPRSQRVAP